MRPRQHQLEDESKYHFQSCLPPGWVYRDKAKDYGIDAEVEVFDKSGNATGKIFNVQLKATDEVSKDKSLKVRIRTDHLMYWAKLDLPTLIVRYTSIDKKIYYKWVHSDLGEINKRLKKTITIKFDETKYWHGNSQKEIIDEIENYRLLRSSHFTLPINLKLKFDEDVGKKISYGQLLMYFQTEASQRQDFINFISYKNEESHGKVIFSKHKTTIYLGGEISSVTYLPVDFDNIKTKEISQVIADVYVTVGIILAHFGHFSEATSLFLTYYKKTSLLDYDSSIFMFHISVSLIKSNRPDDFLRFFDHILKKRKHYNNALAITVGLVRDMDLLHGITANFVLKVLTKMLNASIELGYKEEIGSNHYNIANLLLFSKQYREALTHYCFAKRYDPEYLDRHYFLRELGTTLFELKKYRCSTIAYSKTLEKNDDHEVLPLLADAIMYSGKYKEALEKFKDYRERSDKPNPYWLLKMDALEYIIGKLKIETQSRNTKAAINCIPTDEHRKREEMFEAVKHDALLSSAWFSLGISADREGEFEDAFDCFLVAAILAPRDLVAWVNTLTLAFRNRYLSLVATIFSVAYNINGDALLIPYYEIIDKEAPKQEKIDFKNVLSEVTQFIKSQKKNKTEFAFRIIKDDKIVVYKSDV
ncbi:DUF4365 domain-containing protein [bacterium]|nr:DUF4365 domain-containing protein [bacterium]